MKNDYKYSTEAELASDVINYMSAENWDIYQEVSLGWGDSIADIVAIRGPVSHVIETKLNFGMSVLAQAHHWATSFRCNFISIAIPDNQKSRNKSYYFAIDICEHFGIGIIKASPKTKWNKSTCSILLPAKLIRTNKEYNISKKVNENHKTYKAAGSYRGSHWSPFKDTSKNIQNFIRNNPGCELKELIDGIDHHYSNINNAKSSIRHWIKEGIIKSIDIKKKGNKNTYYLKDSSK